MPPGASPAVPFVTRDHLSFGAGTVIQIQCAVQSSVNQKAYVVGLTKSGKFKFPLLPAGTEAVITTKFEIPDIPIWLSVVDSDASFSYATLYASVGLLIDGDFVTSLCTGYVDYSHPISFPAINDTYKYPPIGNLTKTTTVNPAASAELTTTVPSNEIWLIESITLTLVTSATAATRNVRFNFAFFGGGNLRIPSIVTQIASLTRDYYVSSIPTTPATAIGNDIYVPLPPGMYLNGGTQITTSTDQLQTGDDFGAAQIIHQTWLSNQ